MRSACPTLNMLDHLRRRPGYAGHQIPCRFWEEFKKTVRNGKENNKKMKTSEVNSAALTAESDSNQSFCSTKDQLNNFTIPG